MASPRKYPVNYPASEHRFRGTPNDGSLTIGLRADQLSFVRRQANAERIPVSFIVRRCIQAVMQRHADLWGASTVKEPKA